LRRKRATTSSHAELSFRRHRSMSSASEGESVPSSKGSFPAASAAFLDGCQTPDHRGAAARGSNPGCPERALRRPARAHFSSGRPATVHAVYQ
jgi:hypothetical protein